MYRKIFTPNEQNSSIGIDMGGTVIKIGLVQAGKIIGFQSFPVVSKTIMPNLQHIEDVVDSLLVENNIHPSQLLGIGLASPGIVDPVRKTIIAINDKYEDAKEMDFSAWIKRNWDNVPFCMDNDARAATLGEWRYGAGKSYDNVVVVTIGTGIGTGVVIDGKPLYGKHFQAGSLGGHFVIDHKGRRCTCGNKGCVEALASSSFLAEIIRSDETLSCACRSQADTYDFNRLFALWREGDADAVAICNACMDVWAAGIVNYIHAYDPEVVILGGGVMQSADIIIPRLQERVDALAWCPSGKVRLTVSELGSNAAILGMEYKLLALNESL
ncbi:MAG: ROK family protein [Prevotellaceae bacterium]|jgi:glucokinase|nr:ROK family protein [Prevotellaceae bacterium]